MRIETCLDSEIRKDFCMLASKDQNPNLVRTLGVRTPYSPGLGFTSTYTAGSAWFTASRKKDPGVPAGTLCAKARRLQVDASVENLKPLLSVWTTWVESKHCGSIRVV